MKRYYRFAIFLILLLTVGLLAVIKLTDTDNGFVANDDVILLNEIAHKAASGDVPSDNTAQAREYVILDINGNVLFDNRSDRSEVPTVETAIQRRYPYNYIIKNNQITGSVILTDGEKRFDRLRTTIILIYVGCSLVLITAMLAFGAYIRKTVILPFDKMKDSHPM